MCNVCLLNPLTGIVFYGVFQGGALATLLAHRNPDLSSGVVISSGLIMKTADFTNPIKVCIAFKHVSYLVWSSRMHA